MRKVVVIGSGPGGYVAAIKGAQLGLDVTLIEEKKLGGVCLNTGCIPTKALLYAAHVKHTLDHAKNLGFEVSYTMDFQKVIAHSQKVSAQLHSGVAGLLKKHKINVIAGRAIFKDSHTISIEGQDQIIKTDYTVVATGGSAIVLPGLNVSRRVWTSKEALNPPFFPKRLLIVGSGAIGIEFASFYRAFGSEVTVVEMKEEILPQEDHEIAKMARQYFEGQGIHILTSHPVNDLKENEHSITCTLSQKEHHFDAVILAVGVRANTQNFGLENTKVVVDKGRIVTTEYSMTNDPAIYAIGDVAAAPWLAHKASHEGIIAMMHIAKKPVHPLCTENIPSCVYSLVQIASIGLSEQEANNRTIPIKVGKFPYKANGKALSMGVHTGIIKTIFNVNTGELVGAHLFGEGVSELISCFALGKTAEATNETFIETVFPHPTLSEMIHESALQSNGEAIHF